MIYIGLGNAGSKLLRYYHRFLHRVHDQPDSVPAEAWLRIADRFPDTFVVGDADTDNSVIQEIRRLKLDEQDPPLGIKILPLDRLWSGGCGVYHIIAELVTETAQRERMLQESLPRAGSNQHVTLLIAAGGGTGGGGGDFLARSFIATVGRQARLFAVLPELDSPRQGPNPPDPQEIKGPDDFQCASAGRLLTRFLNDAARNDAARNDADRNRARDHRDLFIISNSCLAEVADNYVEAVKRMNLYISHVLTLLPDPPVCNSDLNLVTLGLGVATREKQASTPGPADLGPTLVHSALAGLDLSKPFPTGLSALPVPMADYHPAFEELIGREPEQSAGRVADARQGGRANNANARQGGRGNRADASFNKDDLKQALEKCFAVRGWLYCNPESYQDKDKVELLRRSCEAELKRIFHPAADAAGPLVAPRSRTEITLNARTFEEPIEYFPRVEGQQTDAALLLCLDNLMIEDVFRLAVFFIESAFPWQTDDVHSVADLIDRIIAARPLETDADFANCRAVLEGGQQADAPDLLGLRAAREKAQDECREEYPPRFWGNITDLKNKVLQRLGKRASDFNAKRLTVDEVVGALVYFQRQVWRFETPPR